MNRIFVIMLLQITDSTCSPSECASYKRNEDVFSYNITGLSPYTDYVIDMRAVTCGGAGIVRTTEDTTMESSMSLTHCINC